ncbi:MAG: TetR/AcrR family transcriptional regulator [Gammaproteobacteria bacterium]
MSKARGNAGAEAPDALGHQAAKSLRTQEAIINAVIALINEGGYAAASSTQIARRAGVSWGAVQHHFGGKEEILDAVLARSHEAFTARLSDPRFTRGNLERRVERFVEAAWAHYQGSEYVATLEILLATRATREANHPPVRVDGDAHLALWRRIFHDVALPDARLREAIYTAHCMLTGILLETVLEPQTFEPRRYLRRLARILLALFREG